MERLRASSTKIKSLSGGWIIFLSSLGVTAGLVFTPVSAEAAPSASAAGSSVKVAKGKVTPVAVKDVEQTGSIDAKDDDTSGCSQSRKRLFVEGEGWIVRKVTICY